MAYNSLEKNSPPPVWALIVLPEGLNNTMFLGPKQHIGGRYAKEAILFEPFLWELPQTQHYKIVNVQSTLTEEEVQKGVEEKLRGYIMESPVIIKRVDRSQKPVWDLRVMFSQIQGENEDEVMPIDTIHVMDRKWKVGGVEWLVRNGDHCIGCHGREHPINRCPQQPHVTPLIDMKTP